MTKQVEQRTVDADEADLRLDRWFKQHFPQVNHIKLQKLLRSGQVRVDGKRAESKTRVQPGQIIRIPPLSDAPLRVEGKEKPVKKSAVRAEVLKAAILYDDDDVVILNKPPGLAVQGGTGLKESLDDWLHLLQTGRDRPRLVHRLDRETSGVLVIARTRFAAAKLAEAFRVRSAQKYYLAILQKCPVPRVSDINEPLMKVEDRKTGGKMVVHKNGDSAQTSYRTLVKAKNGMTLTLLMPHTGRTHQLRVHTQHIGTPIVGDVLYNPDAQDEGLHLHASRLVIPHPREEYGFLDVTAPLPESQAELWRELGFDVTREWAREFDKDEEKKK